MAAFDPPTETIEAVGPDSDELLLLEPRRPWGWLGALRRHPGAVALLLYALVALLANYPTWPVDSSHIATCVCGGNEDPAQTAWFLAWTPFALLHGHNLFLSSWINLPKGVNLADNTGMPLLGLLTAPVTLLGGPVASENLLRWLAFPLSAYAMFFVLRHWVRWAPAAFIGGLLYGFSPYMVGQASVHLNLSFVPLPPLILYMLYELLVAQSRSVLRAGPVLGALAAAQFYISAEVLATTGLTAAIAVVLVVVLHPLQAPRRALHAIQGLGIGAAVLAAGIAYPVYVMTHGAQHYVGPSQGLGEVFNADLLGPILPTLAELVAPHRLASIGSNLVGGRADIDENGSYLGIPLIVLTVYLALRYWRRRWPLYSLLMAVLMFVLSLGPHLYVDGKIHPLSFPLPFTRLQHLPLLEDVLPARFSLYVVLFVSVVLAHGLDAFHDGVVARRWKERSRASGPSWRGMAVLAGRSVGAMLVLASLVAVLPRWPYRSRPVSPAPAAQAAAFAGIAPGASVLTYPYATPFTDDAMLWQAIASMRFKIFGSYMLRPGVGRKATPLAGELSPLDVQAMLSDTLSTIAVPGLPYLVPTAHTVMATRIVVERGRVTHAPSAKATITGVVENANPATGSFFVITGHLGLTGVTVGPKTVYVEPRALSRSPFLRIVRADRVFVYGRVIAGTITPRRVADLRTFLRIHNVGAVVVQLGRVDSTEVAAWVRDAIGAPTRTLANSETWLHVGELLTGTRGRPELAHAAVGRSSSLFAAPRHPPVLVR
ncbi:MAG: hypothetical protein JWO62_1738 [Acidimicrobiaceae bacterium]|nr:hypothetical protein [Acidimicrobiaceae bacterium]